MRWILVGCACFAVLTGCGGSSDPAPPAPTAGVVPNVVGRPRTEAACLLVEARLRWTAGASKRVYSEAPLPCRQDPDGPQSAIAPDPTVTEQDPAAGTRLAPGSVVALEDECTQLRSLNRACA